MNYIFLATVAGDFATEHKNLNALLEALCKLGSSFGSVADKLKDVAIDVSKSDVATAINGIGAGLVTFFMVLEIITYCFNVDFHAGFESAMKIGVKTVLMYIIVENCMSASNAVIGVFKLNNTLDFNASFSTVADPLRDMFSNITFSDNMIIGGIVEPIVYGLILVGLILVLTVLFSMIIVSLIGIIMETTIMTTIAPVACATLVNSQVRQTGISALKNLAAISLQWSVIALSFTVYNEVSTAVNAVNFNDASGGLEVLQKILVVVPSLLCMAGLAAMISKSGEITRRALGA